MASTTLDYLIWQYLKETNRTTLLHQYEQATTIHFNLTYFLSSIVNAQFEEAEQYLLSFVPRDITTTGIVYCIRKNHFLYLLETNPTACIPYLQNYLNVFPTVISEIQRLSSLNSFQEYPPCSSFQTTLQYRKNCVQNEVKVMLDSHPGLVKGIQENIGGNNLLYNIIENEKFDSNVIENIQQIKNCMRNVDYKMERDDGVNVNELKLIDNQNQQNIVTKTLGTGKLIDDFIVWDLSDVGGEILKTILINDVLIIICNNKQGIVVDTQIQKIIGTYSFIHSTVVCNTMKIISDNTNSFILYNDEIIEFLNIQTKLNI
ncbi:hypothetical protein QTN25_005981 [Entamoeba marina]